MSQLKKKTEPMESFIAEIAIEKECKTGEVVDSAVAEETDSNLSSNRKRPKTHVEGLFILIDF